MLLASLALWAAAAVCFYLFHANATVAAMLLMLCVLLAGTRSRRVEAVATSMIAALCFEYYFIPPIGKIMIGDAQGWLSFGVFLTVSLLATNLSSRLRWQRDELAARHTESDRLHALSHAMLLSNGGEDVRRLIVNKCMELFGFSEFALFESATGEIYRSQILGTIPLDDLRRAAVYGSTKGSIEGAQGLDGGATLLPVLLGNKTFGSIGFRGTSLPDATRQSLGNTVAVGLAQAQAQEAGSLAEAVRKSEELKSIMIDAMAHDLKTPLTAIEAATDILVQGSGVSADQRSEMLQIIHQEVSGLRRLVAEAIHLARIEAKRLKLECEPLHVDDLIRAAIQSVGERAASHLIQFEISGDLPRVSADRELMVQALKQLLDNAIKYSPARSTIRVAASEANDLVSISIRDQGQGLTELEQGRVFDKFYRGRYHSSSIQGTGMGLAIAKEILEAHGGSITVESQVGQGTRFTIALQAVRQSKPEEQPA